MLEYIYFIAISVVTSLLATFFLYPRLKRVGMVGLDINKPDNPEVAEMGGLAIIAGATAGMLLAIFFQTFTGLSFNLTFIMAALITIQAVAFIGLVDDLVDIPQRIKAFVPLFAAIPLIVVKAAGSTTLAIPFFGVIDFGLVYIFALIPLAIAVCSNLTNMLAGYNGMEAGMGIIIFATLTALGINSGRVEMSIISVSMLGALVGFYYFNKYPAKVFPGDVGAFTIGCAVASAVIIGNFESAGLILMIPYVMDFFVKAKNKFPRTYQDIKDGKLYPKEGKVVGLVHVVMKKFNGISESNLTLFFIGLETLFAIITLVVYLK